MKYTNLSILAILAVIGIAALCICYANSTRPTHIPKQDPLETTSTSSATTETSLKKKKNCGCCAEKIRELRLQMQKERQAHEARDRQQAAHRASADVDETLAGTPTSVRKNVDSSP